MSYLKTLTAALLLLNSVYLFSQQGWFQLNSGTTTQLNCISSFGSKAWAVGNNGTILRTTNGGMNWFSQFSGTTNDLNYICLIFLRDSVAYIVGDAGTILRSTNYGNNWGIVNSGTNADLNAICPLFDTISVITVGNGGTILKSTNRGSSWVQRTSPVNVNLNNITAAYPMDLFIAGDAGKILHSYEEGNTWFAQTSGTTGNLTSFSTYYLNNNSIVHVVGDNGTILKTTNSGFNWLTVQSGTTQNLSSIYVISYPWDSLLYHIASGANGTMIESINGGIWVNRTIPFNDNINMIEMQNMNTGYAAGNNGMIIKSVGNYAGIDLKYMNANTISTIYRSDGGFNVVKEGGTSPGFEWPKGSGKHARYSSGLWIGALVNGVPRVTTAAYDNEYFPGYTNSSSVPQGRNDSNYHIYNMNLGSAGTDRQFWPNSLLGNSDQGAPVYFDTLTGTWKPLDFGSQTMFYSYTDSYPESHKNSLNGGGSTPLKADIKQLNFSLDVPGVLGNVIFSQYTIINRSNSVWHDAYFTMWSDDDMGESSDDMVGCDSALGLGYTYNGTNNDPVYGIAVPAVGFVMLKGAYLFTGNVNDTVRFCRNKMQVSMNRYRDLGMSVFNFAVNGNPYFHDPEDPEQSYNLLKGLHTNGSPILHPEGFVTTLPYSGDPVTQTGWNASDVDDYRMYVSTGPVDLNPGDTQVIVTAQVIALGTSYLNSITELRLYAAELREFYNSCYTSTVIGIENQSSMLRSFNLRQNYPNPFNPSTVIKYDIPHESRVNIRIFDVTGREVYKITEFRKAGSYEVLFDGSKLASGVYFYSMEAIDNSGVYTDTKKMVLLK